MLTTITRRIALCFWLGFTGWAVAMILAAGYHIAAGSILGTVAVFAMVVAGAAFVVVDMAEEGGRAWNIVGAGVFIGIVCGVIGGLFLTLFMGPADGAALDWSLGAFSSAAVGFMATIATGVATSVATGLAALRSRKGRR